MNSTQRFSNRVEDYHKHRPGYPEQIIDILKQERALLPDAIIADIGSGTGKLAEIFFNRAHTVYGVEPNDAMRRQAEKDFSDVQNFVSITGSAESTTLPPASIDLITAGQAFHWFDREKSFLEFKRILKPNGRVALVWNYRDIDADDLQRDYEAILANNIKDYKKLDHKTITDEKIADFFHKTDVKKYQLRNQQHFDLASLKGRALSSSYVPKPPDPTAERILSHIETLFEKYQQNGLVQFIYKTTLYLGQFN